MSEVHVSWREYWNELDLWQAWTLVELRAERNRSAQGDEDGDSASAPKQPPPPATISQIRGLVKSVE